MNYLDNNKIVQQFGIFNFLLNNWKKKNKYQ